MTYYRSISVLTLIRGRQEHFDHLVAGLKAQNRVPDELVIAYMQDEPPQVPDDTAFAIQYVHVPGGDLPLARARNEAAAAAAGDVLVFLDVDCIPDPWLARRVEEVFEEDLSAVYLPEVHYLAANDESWLDERTGEPRYSELERDAVRHPAKPDVFGTPVTPIDDYGELWGLAFVLHYQTWRDADGMDEAYIGYGAEETDFAQRLKQIDAPMYWLGGTRCFHQHHSVHKPPLQHFESIVRNAQLFRQRWGKWCMDYWLEDFERRGMIKCTDNRIEVLRAPTAAEIDATRQSSEVRFS